MTKNTTWFHQALTPVEKEVLSSFITRHNHWRSVLYNIFQDGNLRGCRREDKDVLENIWYRLGPRIFKVNPLFLPGDGLSVNLNNHKANPLSLTVMGIKDRGETLYCRTDQPVEHLFIPGTGSLSTLRKAHLDYWTAETHPGKLLTLQLGRPQVLRENVASYGPVGPRP